MSSLYSGEKKQKYNYVLHKQRMVKSISKIVEIDMSNCDDSLIFDKILPFHQIFEKSLENEKRY